MGAKGLTVPGIDSAWVDISLAALQRSSITGIQSAATSFLEVAKAGITCLREQLLSLDALPISRPPKFETIASSPMPPFACRFSNLPDRLCPAFR